jgi:phosphoribosylaminoimidazole (AIR) synthetase
MASKTHQAPGKATPKYDLGTITEKVLTNFNGAAEGRKTKKNPTGARKADTPVLFNPDGRGSNGYTVVRMVAASKHGAEPTLQEMAESLEELGYSVTWADDQTSFRASPIKGGKVGGANDADLARKMGLL